MIILRIACAPCWQRVRVSGRVLVRDQRQHPFSRLCFKQRARRGRSWAISRLRSRKAITFQKARRGNYPMSIRAALNPSIYLFGARPILGHQSRTPLVLLCEGRVGHRQSMIGKGQCERRSLTSRSLEDGFLTGKPLAGLIIAKNRFMWQKNAPSRRLCASPIAAWQGLDLLNWENVGAGCHFSCAKHGNSSTRGVFLPHEADKAPIRRCSRQNRMRSKMRKRFRPRKAAI